MKENSIEKQNFIDFIKLDLGKKITPQEAIQKIADFHKANSENVKNAFFNLGNAKEADTVSFEESVNGGTPCIVTRIYDVNGTYVSNSKIDKWTGQPMETVG